MFVITGAERVKKLINDKLEPTETQKITVGDLVAF